MLKKVAAALTAAVLLCAGAAGQIVLKDRQFYTKGSYTAYLSPWSTLTSNLVHLLDYEDRAELDPARFPGATTFTWRWPEKEQATGVAGYNFLTYGGYDFTVPEKPVAPVQLKNLQQFSESFSVNYGLGADFTLLNEFFLTSRRGDSTSKVLEVGFLLHIPTPILRWAITGRQLGTWTDANGRKWQVVVHKTGAAGTYCMFIPWDRKDVLTGSIDFRDALLALRSRGLATGEEWVNGVALGAEPITRTGWMRVMQWNVSLR